MAADRGQEVMLRVSWSVLRHADGQPPPARRGEVILDLGLDESPELTAEEMQRVAFAAKIAVLEVVAERAMRARAEDSRRRAEQASVRGRRASRRKAFSPGQAVEVQCEPCSAWEGATYREPIADWPGRHRVDLDRDRYVNSMTGNDSSLDDPQAYRTRHLAVPSRRIRDL